MFVSALGLSLLLAACGEDAEPDDTVDFATGDFAISTNVVDDQCLDGGLNLLFMPNGTDTPWAWPFPVTLYAESALPSDYMIQLREPFGQLSVTAMLVRTPSRSRRTRTWAFCWVSRSLANAWWILMRWSISPTRRPTRRPVLRPFS